MKLYQSQPWLYRKYVKEGKDIKTIAAEANTSYQTIYRYLTKHGMIKNQRKWAK